MSYTPAHVGIVGLDTVRFHLGDTDTAAEQVLDAEITAVIEIPSIAALSLEPRTYVAAAVCADHLALFYARQADTRNLSLSVSASQRSKAFADLARRLRALAGIPQTPDGATQIAAEMFAGGLTVSGKQSLDADTDAVQPAFRIGQDDNPAAGEGTIPSEVL